MITAPFVVESRKRAVGPNWFLQFFCCSAVQWWDVFWMKIPKFSCQSGSRVKPCQSGQKQAFKVAILWLNWRYIIAIDFVTWIFISYLNKFNKRGKQISLYKSLPFFLTIVPATPNTIRKGVTMYKNKVRSNWNT